MEPRMYISTVPKSYVAPAEISGNDGRFIRFKPIGFKDGKPLEGRFLVCTEWQKKFIENLKDFKNGLIRKAPTAEEIAKEKRLAKINQKKNTLKSVMIDYDNMKKDELNKLAEEIGIEKPTQYKKAELISAIEGEMLK